MKHIHSNEAPAAIGPYSQAVEKNGFIFVSGQIGIDPHTMILVPGGITEECSQVFSNIKSVLGEAGLGIQSIVKTTIYLVEMSDFDQVNDLYASFLGESAPSRATVGVSSLPKNASIEIDCIAIR